ncbi:MAG: hypothetical protein GX639_21950 [Fibrobacter sp.]|nr:hypothetical protein [Fibrobacter sp.]
MQLDNDVRLKLEKCKDIFPRIGVECLNSFAGMTSTIEGSWTILERMPGNFLHNIIIGAGNDTYQAIFGIGFKTDRDFEAIPADSLDERVDIWGELANTYCGMLMDQKIFIDSFSILTQSNPQYTSGDVIISKAWSVSGALTVPDKTTIYLGYAIRRQLICI